MKRTRKSASKPLHATREGWLDAGVIRLKPLVEAAYGAQFKAPIATACGFPSRSAMPGKRTRIGECWSSKAGHGTHHILISPLETDPVKVLGTLAHEMVHAIDDNEHGHKGPFVKACKQLGLVGKPTSNYPGPEFTKTLTTIASELGEYPHRGLVAINHKKQTTRQLKLVCESCGLIIRAARRSIEEMGAPTHCEEEMVFA